MTCPCNKREEIIFSNSATNFKSPVMSVVISIEKNIIRPHQKILEVGSGNLRNMNYILQNIPNIEAYVYDFRSTYERYEEKYTRFQEMGGTILKSNFDKQKYNIILCTYVLEAFCPPKERITLLHKIKNALKRDGRFIGSFRGYKGVVGSKYKPCPSRDGFITPLKTFVKPFSTHEISSFLRSVGFDSIEFLQKYKVERPQNIHLTAW